MGRVTKVLEQPAAGGRVYCTNAASGTRNLADRRQPLLEHSAYLCTLKAAADGIDHLHPSRVAVSTKSDPIRNVNFSREWHSGNFQGAQAEEPSAEQDSTKFGQQQFGRLCVLQSGRWTIAGFHHNHMGSGRYLVEMVEVEDARYGIQSEKLLLPVSGIDDLDLEKAKGNIHVGHGAHRSEEEAASEIHRSPGGELLHGFIACDIRLQTADSCHSRLWNPSGEDACVAHPA